jgi:hypothetical protein
MTVRLLPLVAIALAAVAALEAPAIAAAPRARPGEFETALQPYLASYCLGCHSEKKPKNDFRRDTLSGDFAAGGLAMKWMEVIERISAGEMPPGGTRASRRRKSPPRSRRHIDFNLPKIKNCDLATPVNDYAVCSRPVDGQDRLSNLLLSMANTMGVNVEDLADSTGPMTKLVS